MKKEELQALLDGSAKIVDGKIVFDLDKVHTDVNKFGTSMKLKGEETGKAQGATEAISGLAIEGVKDVTGLKGYITKLNTGKTDVEKELLGITTGLETYKKEVNETIGSLKLESENAKRDSLKVTNKFDSKYTRFIDAAADDYLKENEGKTFKDAYENVATSYPEWVNPEVIVKGGPTPKSEKLTVDEDKRMRELAGLE